MRFKFQEKKKTVLEFTSLDSKLKNTYQSVIDEITVIVDVGVSDGRFIANFRNIFPKCKRFIGIDPLDLYDKVTDFEFVKGLIGRECSEVDFNVAADLFTSSKLYLGESRIISQQYRLDCLLEGLSVSKSEKIFLKLDTQGMDIECLESAIGYLDCVTLALIEVQMRPYSEGMLYFSESISRLKELNFEVCEILNPINRSLDDSLGQIDLLIAPKNSSIFESSSW